MERKFSQPKLSEFLKINKRAKKDLEDNGFVLLKGYLNNDKYMSELIDKVFELVSLQAQKYNIKI